ncbi:MAG: hypothetical protein ACOC0P_02920 [Planctomycetota bacterium]
MAAAEQYDRRQAAKVSSVEVINDFRAALAKFAEEGQAGLAAAEAEIQRRLDWLEHDQTAHWRRELELRRRTLDEARVNLSRKTMGRIEDHLPHREEQMAFEKAKRVVAEAEAKLETIQRWTRALRSASEQYRGAVQGFQDLLTVRVPAARSSLDQINQRLQAYLTTTPPNERSPEGMGFSGSASPTGTDAEEIDSDVDAATDDAADDTSRRASEDDPD